MAKRTAPPNSEYTVLARRYRPQQFADVVGQEPVMRALVNALETNRVAHAYLFTGARGVGKTSTARILAKALNCVKGPTATPCGECDLCKSIATGDDVDVLEIDGASNNGVDEVRELRSNVQYRPSRARYKIYIIDEVHQLSKAAFNALLKTLEEPPPHVKFIFATTEADKIPITVLSRCQRFDFAGIGTARILEQLQQVVKSEGMQVEDDALELVARRAAGSMRDAQSLLDQLLALGAGAEGKLTSEQVRRFLGAADEDLVIALATPVLEQKPEQALEVLQGAVDQGLQLGEVLDQLIQYWRDLMVVNCAGPEAPDLSVSSRHRDTLAKQANALPLDTILAGLDVLTSTKNRLRFSNHGRILLEMALVRLGRMGDLVSLSQLAQWAATGGSREAPSAAAPARTASPSANAGPPEAAPVEKKNVALPVGDNNGAPIELTADSLPRVWQEVTARVGPFLANDLKNATIAISGPKTLALRFPPGYNEHVSVPRTEEALRKITGQTWCLRVESGSNEAVAHPAPAAGTENSQSRYRRQRTEAMQAPLVKRALEVLGAQFVHMDEDFGAAPSATATAATTEGGDGEEE